MISRKYKCLFVHIPKTGGQSVEHFFLKLHGFDWSERAPLLLRQNSEPKIGPQFLAHLTAKEYVECGHISNNDFEKYFKFSFVRNPWAKLVSEFHYGGYYKKHTFKQFIVFGLTEKNNYLNTYRHMMPQYEYLYDKNGKLVVDFVGKIENMQNDFDSICNRLEISHSLLPHVNITNYTKRKGLIGKFKSFISKANSLPKMNYQSYYDEELKEIVGEIYDVDIRTFNYQFL